MDWFDDVLTRFRRDLRWLVLIWIVIIVGVTAYGLLTGGSFANPVGFLAGLIVLGIGMTPLIWMRHEIPIVRPRHNRVRRTVAVVGIGCLWAVVALIVGTSLIAAFGID